MPHAYRIYPPRFRRAVRPRAGRPGADARSVANPRPGPDAGSGGHHGAHPRPRPRPSATPAKRRYHKKAAASPTPSEAASPAPAGTEAAAGPTPATAARARRTPPRLDPNATPAPGGGPGMVWVNTKSKVYHLSTSRYYGKTKEGKYMTEQAAQAEGDHAAPHGE